MEIRSLSLSILELERDKKQVEFQLTVNCGTGSYMRGAFTCKRQAEITNQLGDMGIDVKNIFYATENLGIDSIIRMRSLTFRTFISREFVLNFTTK